MPCKVTGSGGRSTSSGHDAETGGGAYKISGGFSGDETEIEDHSLKMFLAISVGVIGTVAALHISLLFGFAILLAFAIDYAALWWTISKADRAADNDEINQAIAVMFIVGFAGFLPLWAVAELEGVGLVLYGFMAWFATLFSLGAF